MRFVIMILVLGSTLMAAEFPFVGNWSGPVSIDDGPKKGAACQLSFQVAVAEKQIDISKRVYVCPGETIETAALSLEIRESDHQTLFYYPKQIVESGEMLLDADVWTASFYNLGAPLHELSFEWEAKKPVDKISFAERFYHGGISVANRTLIQGDVDRH